MDSCQDRIVIVGMPCCGSIAKVLSVGCPKDGVMEEGVGTHGMRVKRMDDSRNSKGMNYDQQYFIGI